MIRSKLQAFAAEFPRADLFIVSVFENEPTEMVQVKSATTGRVAAEYMRRRDAWRALRTLGYQEEGIYWRQVPKAEQEIVFCAVLERTP